LSYAIFHTIFTVIALALKGVVKLLAFLLRAGH
jgi:hypothetical protein